jgi:rhodanese-related sulfurtransferase
MMRLDADAVRAALLSHEEVALVDVREQVPFAAGHILFAVHAPLSRLEWTLPPLVPCRAARLVLCDGGEGMAERAAEVALAMGYGNIAMLDGGTPAWRAAGFRLFTGLNATGTALAETVDLICSPPQMQPEELARRRATGEAVVVLDSRPWEEYCDHHIPDGIACPGGELVYRAAALVPDAETAVVVNCAGRSRSIFGAQSLINAGLPNPVYALAQGTYGWARAGFELAQGPGPRADGVAGGEAPWARQAARRVAEACGVRSIEAALLNRWCGEIDQRSLYLLDVRSPEEFAAGHVRGARNAPGGQLVECADDWIGVRGGRIVLLDDDGVRAPMSASWLRQLGYPDVAVLADPLQASQVVGLPETSPSPPPPVRQAEMVTDPMAEAAAYLAWQSTLAQEVAEDGLLVFWPYRPDRDGVAP